jgi:hypothetical protein
MCGAPVQKGRVTAVITARTLSGRLGLLRPSLVPICLTVRSSQAHEGDDLMNYEAFGPFVRSFILLVDPGDICPPQVAPSAPPPPPDPQRRSLLGPGGATPRPPASRPPWPRRRGLPGLPGPPVARPPQPPGPRRPPRPLGRGRPSPSARPP